MTISADQETPYALDGVVLHFEQNIVSFMRKLPNNTDKMYSVGSAPIWDEKKPNLSALDIYFWGKEAKVPVALAYLHQKIWSTQLSGENPYIVEALEKQFQKLSTNAGDISEDIRKSIDEQIISIPQDKWKALIAYENFDIGF